MSRPTIPVLSPQNTGSSTPSAYSSTTSRTWNTSTPTSCPTSTVSDEQEGRSWKNGQTTKHPQAGSKPKLPSLKTSSSQGAMNAARSAAGHGKLHKRGNSASSTTASPNAAFPTFDPNYSLNGPSDGMTSPPSVYRDIYAPPTLSSKVKLKPLLRKLSAPEKNQIDLSRSAAENEGLGIYTSSTSIGGKRGGADPAYSTVGRKPTHHRTTSGTSQISTTTTSSNHRPGAQYVHPMRQTPRPYTPPIAHSYQNSLTSSDISCPKPPNISEEGQYHHPSFHNVPYNITVAPYTALPSSGRPVPPLHVRTHSSSRITSPSQTNLPGTPSSLRNHSDTLYTADPMPHTARSSVESAFRKRSRTNTNPDPTAQLAAVQALRAEFNAREAAKEVKFREAEAKAQEKEWKKKEKLDESIRRKSEALERKRAKSNATSEKSVPLSTGGYSSTAIFPLDTEPPTLHHSRRRRGRTTTAGSASKAVSSQWSLFWFKFKTMWMKFKRSMKGGS